MKRGMVQRRKFLYGSAALLTFFVPVAAAALINDDTSPSHKQSSEIKIETSSEGVSLPDVTGPNDQNVETKTSNSTSATVKHNGETEVTVNGVEIPVPQNGSVEQTVPSANNQASIHVNIQSDSSTSSNDNNDGSRVRIRSDADTEVRVRSRSN